MLPQRSFFGKWRGGLLLVIGLLGGLVFTAVILTALSQSETFNYLPAIFKEGVSGTPLPPCDVYFVHEPQAGDDQVLVADDVGRIVSIVDLDSGATLGTDRVEAAEGYDCPGTADYAPPYQLSGDLAASQELEAQSDDGSGDTAVVSTDPTSTPPGISAAAVLTTPTPSATPYGLTLQPNCGTPQQNPDIVAFDVIFTNWPLDQSLTLTWEGNLVQFWEAGQHLGSFTQNYTRSLTQTPYTYAVTALSGNGSADTDSFIVPCPTPIDLLVVGAPQLVSTPPIVAYQPVQFAAVISNSSNTDVNSQFFVDVFLDPTVVFSYSIPITESDGYAAVSWLAAQSTRVVTITAPLGFANEPPDHLVYAMVDSLDNIPESDETNNLSTPLAMSDVTPTSTPMPSPTITLSPTCGLPETDPGPLTFDVTFANWPTNESLTLFWDGTLMQNWTAGQHAGSFTQTYTRIVPQQTDTFPVMALAGGGASDTEIFTVPCPPANSISGVIYTFENGFTPQARATVYLLDATTGNTVALTLSDEDGRYEFTYVSPPTTTYVITSCTIIDNQEYYGYRTGVIPPQDLVYISLLARPCPYPSVPTSTPTHTPTATPTITPTTDPVCGVQFEGVVIETDNFVRVTGEVDSIVTILDLTDGGQQIGVGTLDGPFGGHACPGFVVVAVPEVELVQGHVLAAISSDGTTDTTIVLGGTPTFTPTYTPTPTITPLSRTP